MKPFFTVLKSDPLSCNMHRLCYAIECVTEDMTEIDKICFEL